MEGLVVAEEVPFVGHPMVRATHERTIEITTEAHLTPRGDCILGVRAAKGVAQLAASLKEALRSDGALVKLTIEAPGGRYSFGARGSNELTLGDSRDMVIRTSGYVCGRTLAVRAESSARDIPREIVRSLKSPGAAGLLRIEVQV